MKKETNDNVKTKNFTFKINDIAKNFYDFFETIDEANYYKVDCMLDEIKKWYKKEYENLVRKLVVYVTNCELINYNYDWATSWQAMKNRILHILKYGYMYCFQCPYNFEFFFKALDKNEYIIYYPDNGRYNFKGNGDFPEPTSITKDACYKKYNTLFFENGELGYYSLYMQLRNNLQNFANNYEMSNSKFDLQACLNTLKLFYTKEDFEHVKKQVNIEYNGAGYINDNHEGARDTYNKIKEKNHLWWMYIVQWEISFFHFFAFTWDWMAYFSEKYELIDCLEFSSFDEVKNMQIDSSKIDFIMYGHFLMQDPSLLYEKNSYDISLDQVYNLMDDLKKKYSVEEVFGDVMWVEEYINKMDKPFKIFLWKKKDNINQVQ